MLSFVAAVVQFCRLSKSHNDVEAASLLTQLEQATQNMISSHGVETYAVMIRKIVCSCIVCSCVLLAWQSTYTTKTFCEQLIILCCMCCSCGLEAEECWQLVQSFCQYHHLPPSLAFLTLCAEDNQWLPLLCSAQLYSIPVQKVSVSDSGDRVSW